MTEGQGLRLPVAAIRANDRAGDRPSYPRGLQGSGRAFAPAFMSTGADHAFDILLRDDRSPGSIALRPKSMISCMTASARLLEASRPDRAWR